MNAIKSTFSRSRVLLPVIHTLGFDEAMRSIATAVAAHADGVFVINQDMSVQGILGLVSEVATAYPDLWLGVNFLGCKPSMALELIDHTTFHGIWTDLAMDERGPSRDDQHFNELRPIWEGLYFGGADFKYQPPVKNLPLYLSTITEFVDVVTTSGSATGSPADVAKAIRFRELLGDHALALASGITIDNIETYLPYVDAYLVGTGIEQEFGVLDYDLTSLLADKIHSWE